MKRQKLFAVLAALALLFTAFGCKNDDGSNDSCDSSQPEYVGKIYSAKDRKTWLKIDSEEKATLAVWEDGTAAQSASRAAAATGSYIFRQGKYTISIKDGKNIFSLKLEWTQNGKSYSYEIVADLTNGTTLANFKINGKSVDWGQTTAAPEKPAEDSSGSGGSSSGETSGGSESGGSSGEGEPDYSNIPVPEGFVRVPGVSIKGTEKWTPKSEVFIRKRKLKITSFFMSDHEVTRKEYKDIIGKLPWNVSRAFDKDGNELTGDAAGNNPVSSINWYAAIFYCNKRSIKEGLEPCYTIKGLTNPDVWGDVPEDERNAEWDAATCDFTANGYRLPTEAEWEWAARGGKNYTYAGSDDIEDVAWYDGNNKYGTRDVKSKKANGYGLYDMSGNVWEWCWDMYDCDILVKTPFSGPVVTEGPVWRIPRGGEFGIMDLRCEVGAREDYHDPYYHPSMGFRVVRTIK